MRPLNLLSLVLCNFLIEKWCFICILCPHMHQHICFTVLLILFVLYYFKPPSLLNLGWSALLCNLFSYFRYSYFFWTSIWNPFWSSFWKSATYDHSRVFGTLGIRILVIIFLINQVQDLSVGFGVSIQQCTDLIFQCMFRVDFG